jgi:hypothetical protein
MAGRTQGSYRNSIPTPPLINFAWLKQWWPSTATARQRPRPPRSIRRFFLLDRGKRERSYYAIVDACTKSEARAKFKAMRGIRKGRLPFRFIVKE